MSPGTVVQESIVYFIYDSKWSAMRGKINASNIVQVLQISYFVFIDKRLLCHFIESF